MSGKIHKDVDICVTCVCDKPPQLPLREELPSLGIEVIYNAKGVGAEATEKEFKKERKRIHQKRIEEKQNPPGKNPFSFKFRKSSTKKEDPPEDLAVPKALSYGSYQRSFDERANEDENSISSSIQTSESMDEKLNRSRRKKKLAKRLRGLLKKKNPNVLPGSVEFNSAHTLEDAALQEAFNAFIGDSDDAKPNVTRKDSTSNNLFPDLLPGSKDNPEQLYNDVELQPESEPVTEPVSDASSEVEETTVSSLDNESDIYKSALLKDAEVFSKLAVERLNQLAVDNGAEDAIAREAISGKGNIRVKLLSNGADKHITEIYDLTEISESGNDQPDILSDDNNDVVYHGSSRPTSPYDDNYNDQYSEESSVPVPTMCDPYGKQILDVSNVYEENGPGSPLVISPVAQRGVSAFALSPASFAIPDHGQGKKMRDPYAPSFLRNPMQQNEFARDGRDDIVVYRAERADDVSESFRERNLSPMKLDVASPYRSGDKSKAESFDRAMEDFENFKTKPTSRPIPAMRQNISRDSNDGFRAPKVSFSEDIEERRYFSGETTKESRGSDLTSEPLRNHFSVAKTPRTPKQILLDALSHEDPLPFDFEETIKLYPTIASEKLPRVDTYALHAACLRAFPKRFEKDQICRVKDLVHDLNLYRNLIECLIEADPETCRRVDDNGDLPVHIMARQLMVWEGQWYQKVYDESKSHVQDNGAAGITNLYQSMSEAINLLLQEVLKDGSLCLQPGSTGRILPLHIAAIFTVPYATLKSLLEAFPNAASIKCDLNDIKTFVPNHSTPLELHDRLSTDFPKWEIQSVNFNPNEEITQLKLDKIYGTTNGIRRSDLMFTYCPDLLPYRKDKSRIQRMEEMIKKEMQQQDEKENFMLRRTSEAFWVWLCEFEGEEDYSDNYAESVSRIIGSLPFHSVRFLASVMNEAGHPVLDRAAASCTDAILERLDEISKTHLPVRVQALPKMSSTRSSLLNMFDEDISNRFRLQGQGFIGPLCRTLFNISETNYPTGFVILPYKLVKDGEGRLGLESREAAQVAMKFAEFLSDLTTPNYIIDTLDHKVCQTLGENLVIEMNRASRETRRKHFAAFLRLYEKNTSYFYFIDDCTGVPIVDESNGIYPLLISEAADTVEKVFPMMLSGMISMRGEKAVSIIADVLLNGNIKLVLPNWIEAAKDLIGFTVAPRNELAGARLQGLLPLREDLINFVEHGSTENEAVKQFLSSGVANEWVVEISLIKMILEMRDSRHYFCGLSKQLATSQVLWTHESDIIDESHYVEFKSPKSLRAFVDKVPSPITLTDNDTCSEYSSGVFTDEYSFNEMPRMITTRAKVSEVEKVVSESVADSASYSQEESEQASSVDDSFDLDGVEKLRVELDEQEAKLHDLRDKITSLDAEGAELSQREETIGSMIDEISSQKEDLEKPSRDGLEKAKALLLRICELEDRVLCREVEVGQLKNDVTVFQLEASDRTESRRLDDNHFTSTHSAADPAPDEQEVPKAPSSRDDDIVSVESASLPEVNLNRVLGVGDEESSAGNSTMYDSSIDGYSEGYSTGMLRP